MHVLDSLTFLAFLPADEVVIRLWFMLHLLAKVVGEEAAFLGLEVLGQRGNIQGKSWDVFVKFLMYCFVNLIYLLLPK
jgi:hypothetical protein